MEPSKKAALVKELRERTGLGFLDVKKALEAANYDIEAAIEVLNESGKAKASKKLGRIAADGVVSVIKSNTKVVLFELNSETDFVANNQQFKDLAHQMGQSLLMTSFKNYDEALQIKLPDNRTILKASEDATAKIGEKISFRRVDQQKLTQDSVAGIYTHTNGRIAAYITAHGQNEEALRNVAMHIAAMSPEYLDQASMPEDKLMQYQKQAREIAEQTANFDKKPEKIKDSIIQGQLQKILAEILLTSQPFVMDSGLTVGQYLTQNNLQAITMQRFEVGEGLAKKTVDFASEVAAQIKGN